LIRISSWVDWLNSHIQERIIAGNITGGKNILRKVPSYFLSTGRNLFGYMIQKEPFSPVGGTFSRKHWKPF